MPVSILTPVSTPVFIISFGVSPLTVSMVIPPMVALPTVALLYGDFVDFHVVE